MACVVIPERCSSHVALTMLTAVMMPAIVLIRRVTPQLDRLTYVTDVLEKNEQKNRSA